MPASPRPRPRSALAAFALAALLAAALASTTFGAGPPAARIDMRVLLLGATGTEPTFGAWKAELTREGVPFDARIADDEAPFTDATFADYAAHNARYQAVILATGDLVHQVSNADGTVSFPSALSDAEWAALARFESTFGIRQFSDSTVPSPAHGLNPATSSGEQGGNTGQLTAAGLSVFPYLKGPVPIENPTASTDVFGYQATPAPQAAPASFQTLLSGPNNAAYLGVYTHADGREELVSTLDGNENQLHEELLRHGILDWVTRGVYLGYQRNYFEVEVDDVFLPDDRWDTTLKRTLVDGPTTAADEVTCTEAPAPAGTPECRPIRMVPADVTRLLDWQRANGVKLDMVFNGGGSEEAKADSATGTDPLADAFLGAKANFWWINHTYDHPNLDSVSLGTLESEISDNIRWGTLNGLPMDPTELVTGEHSGLHNPSMPAALTATGIRWTAADNSREPTPYTIGSATTVPRYPSNVYYNVATRAEQLDEYNWVYAPPGAGGNCAAPRTDCRTTAATYADYVASEADIMFRHLMANDARPHFAHQSNLVSEVSGEPGILYDVVDPVLARYKQLFSANAPLVQLKESAIGAQIMRQAKWQSDLAAGRVTAYLQDGKVHVSTTQTLEVPITGTPEGELYGGERSGWFTVAGTAPVVQPATGNGAAVPAAPRGIAVRGTATRSLTIDRLKISSRRFSVSRSGRAARKGARRTPTGATVTWLMSERAKTRVTVVRLVSGRRVNGRCVTAASAKERRGKACTRTVTVGSLSRSAIAGENAVRLTRKIGKRTLSPGRYRVTVGATATDGRKARSKSLTFTVVKG
jgi:hypothetical protein